MKRLLLWLVRVYQIAISPFLGQNCRFYPTCSNYAIEAITKHGSLKGGMLAARRLCRCHPWHAGGFDPVPDTAQHDDSGHHARRHGCTHSTKS